MPTSQIIWSQVIGNPLIAQHTHYNCDLLQQEVHDMLTLLNNEQWIAYDGVVRAFRSGRGGVFFIHGPGGTGKTFLYKLIAKAIHSNGQIVFCSASSGVAAILLHDGATAHSSFKIPIQLHESSSCKIELHSSLGNLFATQNVLCIWDEAPMMSQYAPDALDRTLQDLRKNNHQFGGITMVFGGDFQQVLPVIPKGSREMVVHATFCKSPLWRGLTVFHLTWNMCLENGANPEVRQFAEWLLDVGHGHNQHSTTHVKLPQSMVISRGAGLEDLIRATYPNISSLNLPDQYFSECIILAPCNADVSFHQ